jgi:hypothetical protein
MIMVVSKTHILLPVIVSTHACVDFCRSKIHTIFFELCRRRRRRLLNHDVLHLNGVNLLSDWLPHPKYCMADNGLDSLSSTCKLFDSGFIAA